MKTIGDYQHKFSIGHFIGC